MKFSNDNELLSYLQNSGDLYSAEAEIYAFCYNNRGAIAYYNVPKKEALRLASKAKVHNEYWSAFLGVGGVIIEPDNYEWFDNPSDTVLEEWIRYDWIDTREV